MNRYNNNCCYITFVINICYTLDKTSNSLPWKSPITGWIFVALHDCKIIIAWFLYRKLIAIGRKGGIMNKKTNVKYNR